MSALYPLKFHPIFKERLWGGQKVNTVLGKDFGKMENCGESWELSCVQGDVSIVANGALKGESLSYVLDAHKEALVGHSIYDLFGSKFPLLIKFIDASEDLSIQVHPNDQLAKERHNDLGKSEMWYVIQADNGATLIDGFSKDSSKEEYLEYLDSGRLTEILNVEKVNKGDVFYLPAGRVHTIGKGLLLAEIQQTSDLTYRIYDFDRVDKDGNKRELHTELAVEAIDFKKPDSVKSQYEDLPNQTNEVVKSQYFTTNKFSVDQKIKVDRSSLDSFKIYIGVGGKGTIAGESISFGDVMLVPASMKEFEIEPEGKLELLETYIE